MKTTMNFYDFSRWFEQNRPNNFSRAGLRALFDYFEEFEEDTGQEWEFDGIALCCDFTEYDDLDEFKANYTCEEFQDIEDWEGINDYTIVIPICEKSFLIQNF
tara:strand:+ start:220 stop:528 length:309 start_codon:yes stop_codon:yes gene_type:complete